jgi:hypothetical protein
MTTTTYAADHTALLIVDPYNDFMSKGADTSISERSGCEQQSRALSTESERNH